MLSLAHDGRAAVGFAARVDQLKGIEQAAAVIALIAARVGIAALRASAFDEAVGQEALLGLAVELALSLAVEVAARVEGAEDILRDAMMILSIGVGEQVVTDAARLEGVQKAHVIILKERARRHAALIRLDQDRCAVRIRAADHQHAVALQPMVAREDIGRQIGACHMPDVQIAVGVGPSHRDVDVFRQGRSSFQAVQCHSASQNDNRRRSAVVGQHGRSSAAPQGAVKAGCL